VKLLLDLFCKAGGAGYGYALAGFEVVGVDIEPQKNYPFQFIQADALAVLAGKTKINLADFDIFHASPVCKNYTVCNRPNLSSDITRDDYPRLIPALRELLKATGKPFVIENVMGAKADMRANLMLCASMFGLPMQRHRLFEIGNTDIFIMPPGPCNHKDANISIVGHSVWDYSKEGTTRKDGRRRPDSVPVAVGHVAMGIDWMNKNELSQAIPPAYTQYIGMKL
jgi:DNA (cytosine-5)-methyltransferase 1